MFFCLRITKKNTKKNKSGINDFIKEEKKEKGEREEEEENTFDSDSSCITEDGIDAEGEWITSQYQTGDFNHELENKIQGSEVLEQRTCKYCRYIEYYISFKSLCIPEENQDAFLALHPVSKITPFILNENRYCHMEMANVWASEIDMLYIPFLSITAYKFIPCGESEESHTANYYTCNCNVEKRIDPDRWKYYKAVITD